MIITPDKWKTITRCYSDCLKSSMYCSFGTVDEEGKPNVIPVGSLILRDDRSGFFFDIFCNRMSHDLDSNNHVCVLFVNSGKLFWLKSLHRNAFYKPSGIKLTGTVGEKRSAAQSEIDAFRMRIRPLKKLRGYRTLWQNLEYVRDIEFKEYFPINTGGMTFRL